MYNILLLTMFNFKDSSLVAFRQGPYSPIDHWKYCFNTYGHGMNWFEVDVPTPVQSRKNLFLSTNRQIFFQTKYQRNCEEFLKFHWSASNSIHANRCMYLRVLDSCSPSLSGRKGKPFVLDLLQSCSENDKQQPTQCIENNLMGNDWNFSSGGY